MTPIDFPDLHVTATLDERRVRDPLDLRIRVVLTNFGEATLDLSALAFVYAQLMLRVETADGQFIGAGPPPVPPTGVAPRLVLAPGDTHVLEYEGSQYFVYPIPPGWYRIRFNYRFKLPGRDEVYESDSEWLAFEVVAR